MLGGLSRDAQEAEVCAESCVGAGEEGEGASESITLSIRRAVSSLGSFSLSLRVWYM